MHKLDNVADMCYTLPYRVRRLFNMLSREELHDRLEEDLKALNLPVEEFDLVIRPYSKCFYGRYFPAYEDKRAEIRIYPYRTKNMKFMFSYSTVLYHTIHEVCHHLQYANPNYVRVKGVMHDPEFYRLLNRYEKKAIEMGLIIKEVVAL